MNELSALSLALELQHSPWQARRMRTIPLPPDVQILLHVAAGDEQAIRKASEAMARSRESVCEAAGFFIEQVLLHSDADSYRVLGAGPEASTAELRRNMALLLKWLHPDLDRNRERSIFTARVTNAWNDVKTPERREAYDRLRRKAPSKKRSRRSSAHTKRTARPQHRRVKHRIPSQSFDTTGQRSGGILRRVLLFLFGRAAH